MIVRLRAALRLVLQWLTRRILSPLQRTARFPPTRQTLLSKTSTLTVRSWFSRRLITSSAASAATLVAAIARIHSPTRSVPASPMLQGQHRRRITPDFIRPSQVARIEPREQRNRQSPWAENTELKVPLFMDCGVLFPPQTNQQLGPRPPQEPGPGDFGVAGRTERNHPFPIADSRPTMMNGHGPLATF